MPALGHNTTDTYYSTLFHELTHWTSRHSRCNREIGDKQYAIEELVAIFHCLHLGVIAHPKEESTKYLNSWLRPINSDKKLTFSTSSLAQKAMNYNVSSQEEAHLKYMDLIEKQGKKLKSLKKTKSRFSKILPAKCTALWQNLRER